MKQTHFTKPSHLSTPRTESDASWIAGADPWEPHIPEHSNWKAGASWIFVILGALALAMVFGPR